jgi:hypothetical protein
VTVAIELWLKEDVVTVADVVEQGDDDSEA